MELGKEDKLFLTKISSLVCIQSASVYRVVETCAFQTPVCMGLGLVSLVRSLGDSGTNQILRTTALKGQSA